MIQFLNVLYAVLSYALTAYGLLIIIYTFMTWMPRTFSNPVGNLIARLTEPYMNVFDRFIPSLGGISISPIIALLVLKFVQQLLFWIMSGLVRAV